MISEEVNERDLRKGQERGVVVAFSKVLFQCLCRDFE
jgi:hypothetical protein